MVLIKAFLFDLDGVIVDTARYHYLAWKELANGLGFDLSEEDNEKLKGISRQESLDIVLSLGGISLDTIAKEKLAAEKNLRYLELCNHITAADVLPGVLNFLDEIRYAGLKIALGSASKNAKFILERLDILTYFDSVVDGNRITRGKPDPEIFLTGASDLAVRPEYCVVFEDAESGVAAAKSAGMFAIGVGNAEILKAADLVISGFESFNLKDIRSLG